MKKKFVPELFFEKEQIMLPLSEKSIALFEIKTNIWAFEMINLYQSLKFIQEQSYQRWYFCKQENMVLVKCYTIHEQLIHSLLADIGHHYAVFLDLTLCVWEGKCMTEEECNIAMNKAGTS